MIYGIGIDIVSTKRIKNIIERNDKKKELFLNHIFTEHELKESSKLKNPLFYFSGRWAAKEAFSKALGTGISANCAWKDIEIINTPSGAPACIPQNNAQKIINEANINRIHVSISHERKHACAIVILEKF